MGCAGSSQAKGDGELTFDSSLLLLFFRFILLYRALASVWFPRNRSRKKSGGVRGMNNVLDFCTYFKSDFFFLEKKISDIQRLYEFRRLFSFVLWCGHCNVLADFAKLFGVVISLIWIIVIMEFFKQILEPVL